MHSMARPFCLVNEGFLTKYPDGEWRVRRLAKRRFR